MRSHVLVCLAPAPLLATFEPVPPPAARPARRKNPRPLHSPPRHPPLPRHPNLRRLPCLPLSESQVPDAPRGARCARSHPHGCNKEVNACLPRPVTGMPQIPDSPSKAVSWRRLHHRSYEEQSHETPQASTGDVQRPADRRAAGGLRVPAGCAGVADGAADCHPNPTDARSATPEPSTGAYGKDFYRGRGTTAPPSSLRLRRAARTASTVPTPWVFAISSSTHRSARYLSLSGTRRRIPGGCQGGCHIHQDFLADPTAGFPAAAMPAARRNARPLGQRLSTGALLTRRMGLPSDSRFFAEHLASHGFVVMAALHEDNWGTLFETTYKSEISRPQDMVRQLDFAEEPDRACRERWPA